MDSEKNCVWKMNWMQRLMKVRPPFHRQKISETAVNVELSICSDTIGWATGRVSYL